MIGTSNPAPGVRPAIKLVEMAGVEPASKIHVHMLSPSAPDPKFHQPQAGRETKKLTIPIVLSSPLEKQRLHSPRHVGQVLSGREKAQERLAN